MSAAKTRPRPYHHGDLRAALLAGALDLIGERGARGFSLSQAARRAGVSPAAPYRHFDDKEALLAALIVEGNELLAGEMRARLVGRAVDRSCLPELAAAYVSFALRHRAHFQVMFSAGIDKARFPEVAFSARAALRVAADAAAGDPTPSDEAFGPADMALACWTIAHGVAALAVDGALAVASGEDSPESLARRLVAALVVR